MIPAATPVLETETDPAAPPAGLLGRPAGGFPNQGSTGAMVALLPTAQSAARLALPGREEPGRLHVTLHYLGKADALPDDELEDALSAAEEVASRWPQLLLRECGSALFGDTWGRLADSGGTAAVVLFEGAVGLQGDLMAELRERGRDYPPRFEQYRAHVTLAYAPRDEAGRVIGGRRPGAPLRCDRIVVASAGASAVFPLLGGPAVY